MPDARLYPALDIVWPEAPAADDVDRLLADLDACNPTAIEERPAGIRMFFGSEADRDRARVTLAETNPDVTTEATAVSDEAWAERSQAALGAVRVGRVVIAPPWAEVAESDTQTIVIRIQPSMGFGTGHHASTRLCLQLLQDVALADRSTLDVGTGSAVLAIAAWRLGANPVLAIDVDDDAMTSARENVGLNSASVTLRLADLLAPSAEDSSEFDVVTANLTGALLERAAPELSSLVTPSGVLIVSGFQDEEFEPVTRYLEEAGFTLEAHVMEERWIGARLRKVRS